jgi:hypothetical protein
MQERTFRRIHNAAAWLAVLVNLRHEDTRLPQRVGDDLIQ